MGTQRSADIAAGVFLVVLGLVVLIAALEIQSFFGEVLPPRTLPFTLAISTMLGGLLLSIRAYLYRGPSVPVDWPDTSGWMSLLVSFFSLVVYLLLIEPLGAPVASFCFAAFLVWYLDRRILPALCVGIAVALVIEYAFIKGLMMPFPPPFWNR